MEKVGSLFSGIGGIELGLERTGGFRTVWHCENDAYASAVLKKHWDSIPNLGDITKIDWTKVERPDLICGGFPCQDISVAGKGIGITGKRSGLWREYARAIAGTRPEWVVIENVPALVTRGLGVVLADLWGLGYQPFRPVLIEAASVGANHKRERIFIVAHPNSGGHFHGQAGEHPAETGFTALGEPGSNRDVAYSSIDGRLECPGFTEKVQQPGQQGIQHEKGKQSLMYELEHGNQDVTPAVKLGGWWAVEPEVGRVADEFPGRVDQLKCLGNAVVPAVAEAIGMAILRMEEMI